jgi:hypothetical protein
MGWELPGEVDWALNVEGESGTGSNPRIVEEGRADLIHHLLQHRELSLDPKTKKDMERASTSTASIM